MKTKFKNIMIILLFFFGLGVSESARSEQLIDVMTLVSSCELQEKFSKLLAVQTSVLEGARGIDLSTAATDRLVEQIRSETLDVQSKVFECYSAETAYANSQRDHQGVAGAAETSRYKTAVNQLTDAVASLVNRRTPGLSETIFDVGLNDILSNFYRTWIQAFSTAGNTIAVKGLQDRLSEGFAKMLQLSVDCRTASRAQGTGDCAPLLSELSSLNEKIRARAEDVQPRVDALTKIMASDQAAADGAAAQIANTQYAIQFYQWWIQYAQSMTQYYQSQNQYANSIAAYYNSWAISQLNWYYYSASWMNYFASLGWWTSYYWWYSYAYYFATNYWNLISYANWWSNYASLCQQQIAYLQSFTSSVQRTIASLQSSLPAIQQSVMNATMKVEADKALLKALAVSTLDSEVGLDFGGAWGIVSGTQVANPATGEAACTNAYAYRIVTGAVGVDNPIFECSRMKVAGQETTVDFGGFYGYVNGSPAANPITGSSSCPSGFKSTQILGTANLDYPLYVCTRAHVPGSTELYSYGGIYGYRETKESPNTATGSMSCPKGYTAGLVYGTSRVDYTISFCFRVNASTVVAAAK